MGSLGEERVGAKGVAGQGLRTALAEAIAWQGMGHWVTLCFPHSCWLSLGTGAIWAFVGPALLVIVVGACLAWSWAGREGHAVHTALPVLTASPRARPCRTRQGHQQQASLLQ